MGFSVTDAALEGFRITRARPSAILAWAAVQLVFVVLARLALIWIVGDKAAAFFSLTLFSNPAEMTALAPVIAQYTAAYLALLVILCGVLYPAVDRAVLRPDEGRWGWLRLGLDEARQVGGLCVLGAGPAGRLSGGHGGGSDPGPAVRARPGDGGRDRGDRDRLSGRPRLRHLDRGAAVAGPAGDLRPAPLRSVRYLGADPGPRVAAARRLCDVLGAELPGHGAGLVHRRRDRQLPARRPAPGAAQPPIGTTFASILEPQSIVELLFSALAGGLVTPLMLAPPVYAYRAFAGAGPDEDLRLEARRTQSRVPRLRSSYAGPASAPESAALSRLRRQRPG